MKIDKTRRYTFLGLLLLIPFKTYAQTNKLEDAQLSNLETVIVLGVDEQTYNTDLAGSVDVLTEEELAYEHVDDTLELFSKIPGVYLSRFNQGIINTDIAIRGFAGDGVTPHAKMLIDGVPANLHNGYNELDQLFPINIESLAVFKGTSDPSYGIFNIAGNYSVSTRQDDAKELELTLGSFNTQELQGYFGSSRGNLQQSYAAGYRTSEGYRDHTDLTKYAVSGSWQWQLSQAQQLRVIARHAAYDGDAPGYLPEQEARSNPQSSATYANQDGGDKQSSHLSVHWSQSVNEAIDWRLKGYWQSFERERWVRFSEGGSLGNRYDDQAQMGFISVVDWYLKPGWQFSWGLDYETQSNIEQRFGTLNQARIRDNANVGRNYDYDFSALGTYVKIAHELSDSLRWNLALRLDQLDGRFENLESSEQRDMYDFDVIVQPKFNVVYAASESINVFANLGRSFQHPLGSSAYTAGDKKAKDVSLNDGLEFGAQWAAHGYVVRGSYWQQTAKDEFILLDGVTQNVGETKRDGFDVSFNGSISEAWSYWGSYTTVNSEIVTADESSGGASTQGNELRSIPDFTASLGLSYQITPTVVTRLHLDSQGDYYVNEANAQGQFGDYAVLSFSADYDLDWGTIKVQVNNLTDEYLAYVYDFSTDGTGPIIHSPGDGINGSLSFSLKF